MKRRTVITGIGIISALGDSPRELHGALCRGRRAVRLTSEIGDRELPDPGMAGPIDDFSPARYLGDHNFRPLDRSGQLAVSAAQLALESSGWNGELRAERELDLVVGTTFCSAHTITQFDHNTLISGPKYAKPLDFANTVINAAAGQTAIWHNLRGANTTLAAGKVSGLRALKHAQFQLEEGVSTAALVGGVEELCFETFQAFFQSGHLQNTPDGNSAVPFRKDRSGFNPGEGSGFVAIEESESAGDRGATIFAELRGHGSSYDVSRGSDEENAVTRCAEAIRDAMAHANLEAGEIRCIVCSVNGSAREDRIEALAIERVFGDRVASIPVTGIAGALGETLGASGLLQVAAFIEMARQGRLPGMPGAGQQFDPDLPDLKIPERAIEGEFKTGLIISLGFDGSSAASVITVP